MESGRGPLRTAPPFARFRCLICREFVVGTASGHCPRCAYVPPTAPATPAPLAAVPRELLLAAVALALALIAWHVL